MKGNRIVDAITRGAIIQSQGSGAPVSISDVNSLRVIRFELGGDAPGLQAAVNAQISNLQAAYRSQGFRFEVVYGVK